MVCGCGSACFAGALAMTAVLWFVFWLSCAHRRGEESKRSTGEQALQLCGVDAHVARGLSACVAPLLADHTPLEREHIHLCHSESDASTQGRRSLWWPVCVG
jgi:hypothetical protein